MSFLTLKKKKRITIKYTDYIKFYAHVAHAHHLEQGDKKQT